MKIDLEKIAMLGALGLAAYWLTARTAGAGTLGTKNAAPLIWAQNPTAANPQTSNKANVATAGLNLLSSLFGNKSTAGYAPTFNGSSLPPFSFLDPIDYGFNTSMLGTASPASQADMYALNPPQQYYGLGLDWGSVSEGTWADLTP